VWDFPRAPAAPRLVFGDETRDSIRAAARDIIASSEHRTMSEDDLAEVIEERLLAGAS
jgi:hypothetical protein